MKNFTAFLIKCIFLPVLGLIFFIILMPLIFIGVLFFIFSGRRVISWNCSPFSNHFRQRASRQAENQGKGDYYDVECTVVQDKVESSEKLLEKDHFDHDIKQN